MNTEMFERVFIIAEIGMNHDGSIGQAKAFVDAAAECGVDAVKFQTHIFEAESLPDAPAPKYFTSESREAFFKRTAFTEQQWKDLKDHVESKGVKFISSPFSIEAIEMLERIDVDIYKVPSGEVTNLPYLEAMAQTGKPVILSTGMSSWDEIERAVATITRYNNQLAILQCTSSYPCGYDEVGLNIINEMKEKYKLPVGLSDHTLSIFASLAAVTSGAKIIERHFTLSKKLYGPDAKFSLIPEEMKQLVEGVRGVEVMLNNRVDKDEKAGTLTEMKMIFEKSLVSSGSLSVGTIIEKEHLACKKPADGISADQYMQVMGKKLKIDVNKDHKFTWGDFDNNE